MSEVHYDDATVAQAFDQHRYQHPEAVDRWCDRIGEWLEVSSPELPQSQVLDLGSGTGVWSRVIAQRFDVPVVGVEPGAGMRAQARAAGPKAGVTLVAGTADALPLADCSVTAAWLSTVVHQFPDLPAAAAELRRVLATPAPLLIRNWFVGRHDCIETFRHFPGSERVLQRWRTVEDVIDVFGQAGLGFAGLETVFEHEIGSYDQVLADLPKRRHSDTLLAGLSDDEWAAGLASIEAARDRGEQPQPFSLDLLVFRGEP